MVRFRFFNHGQMATALKHMQPGTGEHGAERCAMLQRDNAIQATPDEQGLNVDVLYLARQLRISARSLDQAGHQAATLPLPFKLRPAADVLPFRAKTVSLGCGNQSQAA